MDESNDLQELGHLLMSMADWLRSPEEFAVLGHVFEDAIYQRGCWDWTPDKNAADNLAYFVDTANWAEKICLKLQDCAEVREALSAIIVSVESTRWEQFSFGDGDAKRIVEAVRVTADSCRKELLWAGARIIAKSKRERETGTPPGERMVSTKDVAKMVNLSHKSMGPYRKDWPSPDDERGGRVADFWLWKNLREVVAKQFPDKADRLPKC